MACGTRVALVYVNISMCGSLCLLANVLNGSDDVGVRSTAADIAAHEFLDVGVGGAALLLKKGDRRHDLARGAVPTLVAIVLDEGCLHRVQVARLAKPFNRGDLVALVHHGQRQAGIDAAAVHVDGAGSALAMVAALLGAGQADGLAQAVEERCAGINAKIELLAVDPEAYGDRSFDCFSGRDVCRGHWSHRGCRLRRSYHRTGSRYDAGRAE